jgi:predicted NBD/HSP70 family sugar kinase
VLIVSVIRMESRSQIAYRIYDGGEITAENQITKETYSFSDVQDVIRVAVCTHPDLKTICLVTPGMISSGVLTYEEAGIHELNVREILKETYDMSVRLYNDADMIALGYSALELEGGDLGVYLLKMKILLRNGAWEGVRNILDFLRQHGITDEINTVWC